MQFISSSQAAVLVPLPKGSAFLISCKSNFDHEQLLVCCVHRDKASDCATCYLQIYADVTAAHDARDASHDAIDVTNTDSSGDQTTS